MREVLLPYPHPGQRTVRAEAKRFNWLSAGRRWRKTTMAMAIAVEEAVRGKRIIWGAPVFDQVRVAWDETHHAARAAAAFNHTRMEATFPTGGSILYRSLDNPDNARGHTADGVVIDECADVKPEAWYEVLRPMLIDTNGWAWGIGTPKGRNWFWVEHQSAHDRQDTAAWQAPTLGVRLVGNGSLERAPHPLENPEIPLAELKELRRTMPERTFEQEVLAQFIELSGGVFRKVLLAATAVPQERAVAGHQYCGGIDWGKLDDFSVFTVIDLATREVVALDRSNHVDYHVQLGRLQALQERFGCGTWIAEQNSIGVPLIEQVVRLGLPVQPFVTTNATKAQAIDALALAFEREEVRILDDPVLVAELQAYDAERLPSGLIRYSAPPGQHDDCVVSLALAWQAAASPPAAGAARDVPAQAYRNAGRERHRSRLWGR